MDAQSDALRLSTRCAFRAPAYTIEIGSAPEAAVGLSAGSGHLRHHPKVSRTRLTGVGDPNPLREIIPVERANPTPLVEKKGPAKPGPLVVRSKVWNFSLRVPLVSTPGSDKRAPSAIAATEGRCMAQWTVAAGSNRRLRSGSRTETRSTRIASGTLRPLAGAEPSGSTPAKGRV